MIRPSDGLVASCCTADADKLSKQQLDADSKAVFNWYKLLDERAQMINNQRVKGCEKTCWRLEDQGLDSRRTKKNNKHITQLIREPEEITLVLPSTCALSCSYCCKELSSSWRRDVITHGDYNIANYRDRYNANLKDRILLQFNEFELDKTELTKTIYKQLFDLLPSVHTVVINGGEPLLYPNLSRLLDQLESTQVVIYTGLGVTVGRLKKLIPILQRPNVSVNISAENIQNYYEFNRFGNSWKKFLMCVDLLRSACKVSFASTLCNLTVFGFGDFLNFFFDADIEVDLVRDPDFLGVNVIDDVSKQMLIEKIKGRPGESIIPFLQSTYSDDQKNMLQLFIKRYMKSRNLTLDIYPKSFQNWLE